MYSKKHTSADTRKISSGIVRIPTPITARAIPGKIYELLPCPGTYVCPLYVTGLNGEPLANTHLPCVHTIKSFVEDLKLQLVELLEIHFKYSR